MVELNKKQCDECGTCVAVCRENALIIVLSLEIKTDRCIKCGRCVKVCPFGALVLKKFKE